MLKNHQLTQTLKNYTGGFAAVVPFNPAVDKLLKLDFTENNQNLSEEILNNTGLFSNYIESELNAAGARYGIGGYAEHRTIYKRSSLFSSTSSTQYLDSVDETKETPEPRRLHLGVDIWGAAETPVYAPLPATVHSFAFNAAFGDYGATLILQHQLRDVTFYTLYGHLSLKSIENKREGETFEKGALIAFFGEPEENGHWPPHLHFQLISNLGGVKGDYPGVCAYAEKETYLANCPDADLILNLMQFAERPL